MRPGASVGALTVTKKVEWAAAGVSEWEIHDALGAAGGAQGWDALHVQGELTVSSTAANPFVVRVRSLDLNGDEGLLTNFNAFEDYAWVIASADELLNFSPNSFVIDDTAFRQLWGASPLGEFALDSEGAAVLLTYAPASSIPGDAWPFNGIVDLNDLNVVRNHFGETGELGIPGDLYPFDGRVNLNDLNLLRNHFGSQAAGSAVPEPPSLVLLALGAGLIAARRWRSNGAQLL